MKLPNSEMLSPALTNEWLEADGLGGFASGTVGGVRTRRYHALLLAATRPPAGRVVLVNGIEAWVEIASGRHALSTQRYTPDVLYPDGHERIVSYASEPWPQWRYRTEDGLEIVQEIVAVRHRPVVALRWRLLVGQQARLVVRPLLSGRDYHALHHENPAFGFEPEVVDRSVVWQPYHGLPAIVVASNGDYRHEPVWYRNFLYQAELERGLDCVEDLASPGSFTIELDGQDAVLILGAGELEPGAATAPEAHAREIFDGEAARRSRHTSPLERAVEAYVVQRGDGKSIIAGYPWFTDWGRDTFIALRGFMTVPGGLDLAREILLAWAPTVSEGMVPNRFPDAGDAPEYNSVDASLWYVIAAHAFLQAARTAGIELPPTTVQALHEATDRIVAGYRKGTRFGIRMAEDGLIEAGVHGTQLTWMDAKVGDWVVTPRIGKPVEIQALWLNVLRIAAIRSPALAELQACAASAFRDRFWNRDRGCLLDVVDVDHRRGEDDAALRPNQIFAVGGLPFQVLEGEPAKRVVAIVERELLTPLGLRSLAPGEPGYQPRYQGGVRERDGAYHQGTVWPWLIGPFVEAWLRVHGDQFERRHEARRRFLAPLLEHLTAAGLGHVSEIADGEAPHCPRGCPFQAWSLGELLRVERMLGRSEARIDPADGQSIIVAKDRA